MWFCCRDFTFEAPAKAIMLIYRLELMFGVFGGWIRFLFLFSFFFNTVSSALGRYDLSDMESDFLSIVFLLLLIDVCCCC